MLQSLHVHNFALLEDAHADFTPGFNVFTGETGAGKSILIDCMGLLAGDRAGLCSRAPKRGLRRGNERFPLICAVFLQIMLAFPLGM